MTTEERQLCTPDSNIEISGEEIQLLPKKTNEVGRNAANSI